VAKLDLVRDCLDKQVVDRRGKYMGRVDGLVLEYEPGKQPRVAFIEIGFVAQARRLHPALGRLAQRVSKWWSVCAEDPQRIAWSKLVAAAIEIIAAVEAEEEAVLAWEKWLRRHIVSRIPGA